MRGGRVGARLFLLVVLVSLAAAGYTAYAGTSVCRHLETGRTNLIAAQTRIEAATGSGDRGQLTAAGDQLRSAEQQFQSAHDQASNDPALGAVGHLSAAGLQIDASAHLAAIGVDLCRAGEAAAIIAVQVAGIKDQYAGRALSADDLQRLLQQAQAVTTKYQASTQAIGVALRAAHAERAQVTTTSLAAPLRDAYDQVDRALAEADTAFLRYQDVRQVLSQFLGIRLTP